MNKAGFCKEVGLSHRKYLGTLRAVHYLIVSNNRPGRHMGHFVYRRKSAAGKK